MVDGGNLADDADPIGAKGLSHDTARDAAVPQVQHEASLPNLLGTNVHLDLEMEAVSGEDELDSSVARAARISPLSPEKGTGQIQEHGEIVIESPLDGDSNVTEDGAGSLLREAHVRGPGETTPQRHCEVWHLLRELDFYHLTLCMLLTAVSGLFIAGTRQTFSNHVL